MSAPYADFRISLCVCVRVCVINAWPCEGYYTRCNKRIEARKFERRRGNGWRRTWQADRNEMASSPSSAHRFISFHNFVIQFESRRHFYSRHRHQWAPPILPGVRACTAINSNRSLFHALAGHPYVIVYGILIKFIPIEHKLLLGVNGPH